jgi:hypothetical protein
MERGRAGRRSGRGFSGQASRRISSTMFSMTKQRTKRKIKRSFTLAPESVAFVRDLRRRRKTRSDSEALDLLLREAIHARKREEIDAAFKEYYDTASCEELNEQREWAAGTAPNMWIGVPE